ncbi:MAG: tautomerase family protein [Candidatus Omnitrophota bacterium]
MPYINLKLVGTLTPEQKKDIAKDFSETLERVAGKPRDHLYLVIDEIPGSNWAKGDQFFG